MIGIVVAIVLLVLGAGEITAGVWQLFGQSWGLITLGLFTAGFGAIIARGIR